MNLDRCTEFTASLSFPTVPTGAGVAVVGGAVRDLLMGRTPKDLDFVVWGCTPEQFQATNPAARFVGAEEPGRAKPVFLINGSEVAMARRERKVGPGNGGFEFSTGPEVTLKEDLSRRDLTVNAMALLPSGELVDPFNGMAAISSRVLAHVGPAFTEDPLRVFRLARFAATLDFSIAPWTVLLARSMRPTLSTLPRDRIVKELRRALDSSNVGNFFRALEEMEALDMFHNGLVAPGFAASTAAERFASACRVMTEEEIMEMDARLTLPVELRQAALATARFRRALDRLESAGIVRAIVAGARGPLGVEGLARGAHVSGLIPVMKEIMAVKPNLDLKGAAIGTDMLLRQADIWEKA